MGVWGLPIKLKCFSLVIRKVFIRRNVRLRNTSIGKWTTIEDIIFELRTEKICINALKWAIQRYNTNDYIVRRVMAARIMKSFPNDILITGFVMGHLTDFS